MKIKVLAIIALLAALLSPVATAGAATKSCAPTQPVEEGPYYLPNSPTRSDVTDSQAGKKMTLTFTVVDTACKPVKGARVDIWYANAQGIYSGVASRGDDLGAGVNSGNLSINLRNTGASTVDDADRTNSPTSCNLASSSLLSSPNSFANSYTRTLDTHLLSWPAHFYANLN